jgi:membrane-associated phospholipid phosphatase
MLDPIWILDYIGYFGSFFVVSLVFLRLFSGGRFLYSIVFLIGAFVNYGIDVLLKGFFKDPRPSGPIEMILPRWSWPVDGALTTDNSLYQGVIKYGFPSGHAQSVFYGTSFLFAFERGYLGGWTLPLCFLVCALTVLQRYKYRRHSVSQLVAGSLLGWIIGWSMYQVAKIVAKYQD